MTTLTKKITVPSDRRVLLEFTLPEDVRPGEAEIRMEIHETGHPGTPRNVHLWAGALAGSPIFEGDPVEIQRKMRDEWPD